MIDTYHIRVTPRALEDITAIFNDLKERSPATADKMIREILDAIDALETFPARYPLVRTKSAGVRKIRSMVVRPYIIRYRVDEQRAAVHILRARHGARRNA